MQSFLEFRSIGNSDLHIFEESRKGSKNFHCLNSFFPGPGQVKILILHMNIDDNSR